MTNTNGIHKNMNNSKQYKSVSTFSASCLYTANEMQYPSVESTVVTVSIVVLVVYVQLMIGFLNVGSGVSAPGMRVAESETPIYEVKSTEYLQ